MKSNKNTKEVINLIWTSEKDITSKPIATSGGKGSGTDHPGCGSGCGTGGGCGIACCCSVPSIITKWLCNG